MDDFVSPKKFKTDSSIVNPKDEDKSKENCPADLPPQEMAFSIDHILEQIFGFLDTQDLFTCRLVSHRFLQGAQGPLGKRISKSLRGLDTLEQLTEFLEQSAAASKSDQNLFAFPCTNFSIYEPQLGDCVLQRFFNVYGSDIQMLKIFPSERDNCEEDVRLKQLGKLLTLQAPNLIRLEIEIYPTVKLEQGITVQGSSRNGISPLLTDSEIQQISSIVESFPRKSNLKFLKISGHGFAKTVIFLCQLSPKLEHVVFSQGVITEPVIKYRNHRRLQREAFRIQLLKMYSNFGLDGEDSAHLPAIEFNVDLRGNRPGGSCWKSTPSLAYLQEEIRKLIPNACIEIVDENN